MGTTHRRSALSYFQHLNPGPFWTNPLPRVFGWMVLAVGQGTDGPRVSFAASVLSASLTTYELLGDEQGTSLLLPLSSLPQLSFAPKTISYVKFTSCCRFCPLTMACWRLPTLRRSSSESNPHSCSIVKAIVNTVQLPYFSFHQLSHVEPPVLWMFGGRGRRTKFVPFSS